MGLGHTPGQASSSYKSACQTWTLVVHLPLCGVSRTEPELGSAADVFQLLHPLCGLLVLNATPDMPSSRHMTPSESSVPSQFLARQVWGMPHDHCLTPPPPRQALAQHPVVCWPEAPRSKALDRQEPLPNLENRVGCVALNRAPGELLQPGPRELQCLRLGHCSCLPSARHSIECCLIVPLSS